MSRTTKSLTTLIIATAMLLTSCSGSDNNDAKTTTTESPIVYGLKTECPQGTDFCVDFPIDINGDKFSETVQSSTFQNDGVYPTHTEYFTWILGDETDEMYTVQVYKNSPDAVEALVGGYQEGWDCEWDADLPFKASICTRTSTKYGTNIEMFVGGANELYVFQASSESATPPAYADQFFASFDPNGQLEGN